MKLKLTTEQIEEAIQLYLNKYNLSKIAEKFGVCNTTISKYLKMHGCIPTKGGYPSYNKFSVEKEHEIVEMYKKGKSQKEIGILFNTSNTAIRRVLLRNKVLIRTGDKVLRYCKHNPFKSYKRHDEYSEYFLGLLLTDGCISKNKTKTSSSINLSLNSSDGYIVEKFRDWISPKSKVSIIYQKKFNTYLSSINITNTETVEWLNRKGNFVNKSRDCKIYCPITWHILRGIFDGDGGWHLTNHNQGLNFFVCGLSKSFMEQIVYFLKKQNIDAKIRFAAPTKWRKNGLYYAEVLKYKDVVKIGYNMYLNAHIFLKRKYEKWLSFYENKGKKYTLNSGKEMAI